MRVMYFISVLGHGKGGHFHSLNHIAAAIGEKIDVEIYTIGPGRSDVISKNPFFKGHLTFNVGNFFSFKKQINKNVKRFDPIIIHCFDYKSYSTVSLVVSSRYNIVVNKCGGPNPKGFPFIQNLILFSKENQQWFENQKKFKNSSIYLIPNRVNKDELLINESYKSIIKKDAFCFVRITRIGKAYKKSIEDAIRLIVQTKTEGANVHLYIIGTIEDEALFSDFEIQCHKLPITFVTDNEYTRKASNMLYLADAVIATGRGIMEGTGLGKPILTPAQNAKLPILVSKENFETFLATNFSQRNVASQNDIQSNINNICQLIEDKEFYKKLENQSSLFFNEYFDVQGAVSKYIQVYENIIKKSIPKKSTFRNLKYQLKTIYSFIRK